jgi:4-hydroxy-3-polyprenylbenzoate decarboxylase
MEFNMAYPGLRAFVAALSAAGELKRIPVEVDPELEITAITDRVSKAGGPALLFERVKGSRFPLLINAFGSERRMALALGRASLTEAAEEISRLIAMAERAPGASWPERIKMAPKALQVALSLRPKTVKAAPCQEVVMTEPNLDLLPVLKCWPQDAGKFITLPQVYTRDPESGRLNAGMYRMQLYDAVTTGMHWHVHHDGAHNYRAARRRGEERVEIAVALGGDPALTYAATAPLPREIEEVMLAGFLRRKPVELVRCLTVDMLAPADADFVLEGYVDASELRREGPFGDHTGYYSLAGDYPVFHLTALTHRRDAIYPATVVGRPPMEDCYLAYATERLFTPLIKLQIPEIQDLHMPMEGVFHNCVCVAIDKRFPHHARKVMNALWGMGQMMFAKFIIVVDREVNVHNLSEVLWKVFNNVEPRRDLQIVEGPLDVLDHSAPQALFGGKLGIDATKKWPEEGHGRPWPDDIVMREDILDLVERRWREYGF